MIESMEDFTFYIQNATDEELFDLMTTLQTFNYYLERQEEIPPISGHSRKYVSKKSSQ